MSPSPEQGPLVRSVLRMLTQVRDQKVIDLRAFAAGREHSAALQKSLPPPSEAAGRYPAHALYCSVQNQISVMFETITALPALARLAEIVAKAQTEYMPMGPPMSPLTNSYFSGWAFYDAAVGKARETAADCICAVARHAGADPEFLRVMELLRQSRLGLHVCEGTDRQGVNLRELVSGERSSCIVPAGYRGRRGEIWLARVLPPPAPQFSASVVMTTPYVILQPGEQDWQKFLERTLPRVRAADPRQAYAQLMKYGLELHFWNEYIFEAYANYRSEVIFLCGLPDVPESRPNSAINS